MNHQSMVLKVFCVLLCVGICVVVSQNINFIENKLEGTIHNKNEAIEKFDSFKPYWTWECERNRCVKSKISADSSTPPQSVGVCKLKCGEYRTLWPRPTGDMIIGEELVAVNPVSVELVASESTVRSLISDDIDFVKELTKNFKAKMEKRFGSKFIDKRDGNTKLLYINLEIAEPSLSDSENRDESYTIRTKDTSDHVNATINAATFFGAHHGVETLSQLIIYDPYTESVVMPEKVDITDSPAYAYRGILLDTARNFIPIEVIKRTIDGMAVNKLNYFHWHMTDTHSFPFDSRKYPTLAASGAYSSEKIYSREDIKEIVHYALVRGVHIIPELDAPAHVGAGWNSIEKHKNELVVCYNKEPWGSYCVEPPCGQLNPVSDRVYEVLGHLYEEMTDLFRSDLSGLFHMGGDEVNSNCWRSVKGITDWMEAQGVQASGSGFLELWDYFQKRAFNKLKNTKRKPKRAILWTSGLTEGESLTKYLDNRNYIIQIWTSGADGQVSQLLKNNFPVIFSNYDSLYFDCGFGAWVGEGNNWCSPYIGWQKVYRNDPMSLAQRSGMNMSNADIKSLILGAEATLWTEQVDGSSVDGRLWPRAAALAERLWSNPSTSWIEAEDRFLHQRERLVEIGIAAEALEPEWCYQNEGHCN